MSRAQTGEMAHEYLCGGISFLPPLAPPPLQRSAAFVLHGRLVRAKRMVVAANPTEYEYIEEAAYRRSGTELLKNESYREQIKLKAKEVEEKDLTLQAKEYEEGLVATPARTLAKGHAAATSFGKEEISKEPTSTANTFQPGSWMPNDHCAFADQSPTGTSLLRAVLSVSAPFGPWGQCPASI
ncbi:hypothetical protein L3Q82_006909 [Scortum barcoo]|uniref:Uncharacterized protein n=1 Tax=Scortum barcoo TaxID=214431 RepID=A0ACB8WW35_9TELE|nr:hypothetical protein L3Q82_006909 [Scortum barcoo]